MNENNEFSKLSNLYIATSGWSYKWQNIFYPEGIKSADYLKYYSTQFNATEINSSFYNYTMVKTIEKWLKSTPEYFKFCPKLHKEITHQKKLKDIEDNLNIFMSRFALMGNRLGPILIQLPASFKFNLGVAEPFFKILKEKYNEFKFALEVRHNSWFTEESVTLMKNYNIILVIASSGKRFPYHEIVTTNTIYLRLHGDDTLYSSSYTDKQLKKYAEMVKQWLKEKKEVWIFFNNTMNGAAIENARLIRKLIETP